MFVHIPEGERCHLGGQLEFRQHQAAAVRILLRILSRTISGMLIKEHDVLTVEKVLKIEPRRSGNAARLQRCNSYPWNMCRCFVDVSVCALIACLGIVRRRRPDIVHINILDTICCLRRKQQSHRNEFGIDGQQVSRQASRIFSFNLRPLLPKSHHTYTRCTKVFMALITTAACKIDYFRLRANSSVSRISIPGCGHTEPETCIYALIDSQPKCFEHRRRGLK